jgi:hypothetical protein
MSKKFYVYLYRDPLSNNVVVYVGSGKSRRAWWPLGFQTNTAIECLIQERRQSGVIMQPEIVSYFNTRSNAYIAEAKLITLIGSKEAGGTLLNSYFPWNVSLRNIDFKQEHPLHQGRVRRLSSKRNGLEQHFLRLAGRLES